MDERWLIVGLGNPGREYAKTRHNAGFIIMDEICKELDVKFDNQMFSGLIKHLKIKDNKCILLKPQTFMNNSGFSVFNIAQYYKIPLNRIIIIQDDTNFNIDKVKIKKSSSAGGHKGVNSVIEYFNSQDFIRIKLGVNNKPNRFIDLKDWVVSEFTNDELKNLKSCALEVLDIIEMIIHNEIDKAMNKYNCK